MSCFESKIKNIHSIDNLNIVEFDFNGIDLKMMSLDLNSSVKIGKIVKLCVKPTNVIIAKKFDGQISLSNKFKAIVYDLQNGKLLSCITLKVNDFFIQSIITLDSSVKMQLKKEDEVLVLIKASDISIQEVL